MDNKKTVLILFAVVTVSGCLHTGQIGPDTSTAPSKGLQIATFDISDNTLNPGQQGLITVELNNYHEKDIQIDDISLYNTGILTVGSKSCSPTSDEIRAWNQDVTPTVECTWSVNVPEENVQSFNSKTIPIKLNLEYNSELSNNKKPLKIHFKPLSEIQQTNTVSETYSNNEVSMKVETESPIQFQGNPVTINLNNAGNGRINSNYKLNYTPKSVLDDCPNEKEPLVEEESQFTCDILPQTENSQTRNLIFSTSYKYIKAPTLDVEVVKRQ